MKDYSISVLADIYGSLLTKKQLDLLRDYYDNDLSLSELSDKYQIARQSAKDAVNAAEKSLNEFDKKLNFSKRFKQIESAVDELVAQCGKNYIQAAEKIKSALYDKTETK
jgi:predicted DNA-binding protein YlxM (UPF0122 family)